MLSDTQLRDDQLSDDQLRMKLTQLAADSSQAGCTAAPSADVVTPGPPLTLTVRASLTPRFNDVASITQNAVWSCPAGGAQAASCDVVAAGTVPALTHLATVKTVFLSSPPSSLPLCLTTY
ncbi:V-type proton ATPase subunit D [Dissostichus eleginoides]|uniref:V-type proton ATPase subunit D n=1 Tax=Dissostichus eleginoides TaxID=100907 RepID=A0AAD9CG45_DISEL|nr:V-type proton ATPase subunit D [Dissostichus eleginoides]